MENTLLPYFVAFQPPDVRERALAELVGDFRDAYRMPYQFGLLKDGVRLPAALRYCPTCCEEMQKKPGEFYWRRDHQLPGVFVCPEHGLPLAESQVVLARTAWDEFIAANVNNCPPNPEPPVWTSRVGTVKLLHEIAVSSASLLKLPMPERSPDALEEEILVALRSRGFGSGKRSLNLPQLREAFIAHFGPVLDIVPDAVPGDWLKKMTLKYEPPLAAPIRHVAIDLLIASMPLDKCKNPFGAGPWPCRNPLADHCEQMVITECELHDEHGEISGVFRCSCGYVFSRSSNLANSVQVLDRGPLFNTQLCELVKARTDPGDIARALHVSYMTVLQQVAQLGLKTSWQIPNKRSKRPEVDREAMRNTWTEAHLANPNLTRRQLHQNFPTVYGWLRWNDSNWLKEQPPHEIVRRSRNKPGKKWLAVDASTAQLLQQEAARLRVLDPPKRISRTALVRVLNKRLWFEMNLDKLPLCVSALAELAESTNHFQCRRIAWAAKELECQDLPISVTRLRRLAGLPSRCTPDVEECLRKTTEAT